MEYGDFHLLIAGQMQLTSTVTRARAIHPPMQSEQLISAPFLVTSQKPSVQLALNQPFLGTALRYHGDRHVKNNQGLSAKEAKD